MSRRSLVFWFYPCIVLTSLNLILSNGISLRPNRNFNALESSFLTGPATVVFAPQYTQKVPALSFAAPSTSDDEYGYIQDSIMNSIHPPKSAPQPQESRPKQHIIISSDPLAELKARR